MATPNWPTGLNHLANKGSWSFKPRTDSARTDFDQGPARMRRRYTRSFSGVEFSVAMTYLEFEMFKTFVDQDLFQGTKWFNMTVFRGSAYGTTQVRFKSAEEPYSVVERGFNLVDVSLNLETRDNTVVLSTGTVWLIGQWGEVYVEDFADQLQILVNTDYPAIFS